MGKRITEMQFLPVDVTSVIGSIAGICTTLAFVPQVIKIRRTKSTNDISLAMFLIFCIGVGLWLIYGFMQSDMPIILANAMTLVLAGDILWAKLFCKNPNITNSDKA